MTVATKLSEARKLIERGWSHHYLKRGRCVCLVGAINVVTNDDPFNWEPSPMRDGMVAALARAIGTTQIGTWNDDPKRKKSEVIEAFKRAEQLARDSAE